MINIHVINKNNKYIVFHPESLSLFLVSNDIGKTLELYESQFGSPTLTTAKRNSYGNEIDKLVNYFVDKSKINACKDLNWETKEPKTLCLFISQNCNLRCDYCFADHGAFGGDEKLMTFETAKNCIDKILSGKFNNFIEFFGGEPFLNFPLMKKIEEYGRKRGLEIKFTTVTNGTIMNDKIEKFITEKLLYVCVSLDGPKEINDIQRYGDTKSVHDRAVKTIKRLKSIKTPFSIKCTATKNSINRVNDIAKYICYLGPNSFGFSPVDMIPHVSELNISDSDFEIYAKEISDILVKNINQLASGDITTYISPIPRIIRQLVSKTRIIHHCSAGREYIAVTADGDIYPCHEFVGIDEFKMGNVNDSSFPGEDYNRIKRIFAHHSIYAFEDCKSCWARFLCGGDCAVRSYMYKGDLFSPTRRKCILNKSILEALLPEIAEIFQDKNKMYNIMRLFKDSRQCNIPESPLEG